MAEKMIAVKEETHDQLKKIATKEARTLRSIIERALNEYEEKHKKSR